MLFDGCNNSMRECSLAEDKIATAMNETGW